ncbi:MAG: M13 family metallopeptidase [Cyclobacteriaceae bacterium]|nr:M13 family metallopeptidase [Cyclobacteriaceae bacterium]
MKKIALLVLGATFFACAPKESTTEEMPAIVLDNMDTTINPADDFFSYVNGNWVKKTEIPGDQGRWGSFNELREYSNDVVMDVITKAAESGKYAEGTDQKKAADFFSVGMDSLLAESAGTKPIQKYLSMVEDIKNEDDLQKFMSYQQIYWGGAFFDFFVLQDLMQSDIMTTYLSQGGLGLPDRDYYTKTDSKSKETREKYEAFVAKMFELVAGVDAEKAAQNATIVMDIETQLAEASMTNVEQRNIPALYNKMSVAEIAELAPSFNWNQYLSDMGANGIDTLIVMQPKFIQEFEKIVTTVPTEDWKTYLEWTVINGNANYLNHEVVQTNFDFYGKELSGTTEMRPRWKRVLGTTNRFMGEAIGKLYVDETFPPEAKEKALEMVGYLKKAYEKRINELDWMTDSTKEQAIAKLNTYMVKIGYPDKWKDYSKLEVKSGGEDASYIDNVLLAYKFQFEEQLDKLGKPVDKTEWGMNPQTVNAYYNPLQNEIVFPAAILQPPFYNYKADAAVNFGGIGAVIGHEISHGFDDQGARFDPDGNMKNWWSEEDLENFKARNGKLIDQFAAFEPLDSVHVNGELTLGENIGDLGGINAAYDALEMYLNDHGRPANIDGFTPEQRFFISWATVWRTKYRDEFLRTQVNTDPHSPAMYRANGPLQNLTTFYEAFNVKPGNGMYREDSVRVKIW